jgi:hypothetical protein
MGGGRRSHHQHHHVDPGLGAGVATLQDTAPAEQPQPDHVEHLPTPRSRLIDGLRFSYADNDADHGLLDVTFRNVENGNLQTTRYADVPVELWRQIQQAGDDASISRAINNDVFGYFTSHTLDEDDLRPQPGTAETTAVQEEPATNAATTSRGQQAHCPHCGQFVGDTAHDCPVTTAARRTYVSEQGQLRIPNATALREHCDFGDDAQLRIPLEGYYRLPDDPHGYAVFGDATIPGPRAEFDPAAAAADLSCGCGRAGCQHAQLAAAELVDLMRSPRVRTPDRRASTAVLGELAAEHDESVRAQERARSEPPAAGMSYMLNPSAFETAYRQAQQRVADGEQPIPYLTENATGGLGSRDGGRPFGVELEFDLPRDANHATALRSIAEDLYQAGLSRSRTMDRWHASARDGYTEAPNAWRLEHDSTVAGEIVSPILWDTPETWRNLATVCDIVRRHGGQASVRAGGHVHVGAGNFDHTVENHNRLMQLVDAHSDTLFRLASNPERGTHRGVRWCSPNRIPAQGYRDIGHARDANNGHNLAVNMQSVFGGHSDHVEYRMWDSSLDPAVIQSQIKVSLGLTEAAFRDAGSPARPNGGRVDRLGDHHAQFGRRRLVGEQWRQATRGFRSLMDTVFHRDEDRAQLTGLFAVTRWQRARATR